MVSKRIYILLDIVSGKTKQVAKILRTSPGVVMVDALEGPPDVIMLMEATEREQLTEMTMQALDLVKTMIENAYLLPTKHEPGTGTPEYPSLPDETGDEENIQSSSVSRPSPWEYAEDEDEPPFVLMAG